MARDLSLSVSVSVSYSTKGIIFTGAVPSRPGQPNAPKMHVSSSLEAANPQGSWPAGWLAGWLAGLPLCGCVWLAGWLAVWLPGWLRVWVLSRLSRSSLSRSVIQASIRDPWRGLPSIKSSRHGRIYGRIYVSLTLSLYLLFIFLKDIS